LGIKGVSLIGIVLSVIVFFASLIMLVIPVSLSAIVVGLIFLGMFIGSFFGYDKSNN